MTPAPTLRRRIAAIVFLSMCSAMITAHAQIAVTTWHYDNTRTGANLSETILTPQNVNPNTFGKIFTQPVDGAITGQALYLPNVTIPGAGVHNVVYIATMHDSVYAFDADKATGRNARPLWHVSFLVNGAIPVPIEQQRCGGTTGWTEVGVVSTPVIDPASGTLYVVAKTYENSSYVHRLHALDVTTGAEKAGSPVVITGSFRLGPKSSTFQDYMQVNRPGLLLANGNLYVAFGSNGCRSGKESGWVLAYNAATLSPQGVFNTEPGSSAAAIWQRGGGLSADSAGAIYGVTADGPFSPGTNFGVSVLKLAQAGSTLQLSDWFTPYNQAYLNDHDLDLSEPVLLLPDQPGPYPHEAVAVGKEGTIYVLDRDNLGHFSSSGDSQIVQELTSFAGETGALVYWNGLVYTSGVASEIKAFSLNNGQLGKTPLAQSRKLANQHSPVITSNGTVGGVLWQISGSSLMAFDASTLARTYFSKQASHDRDLLPPVPHFASVIVVHGKVYIGTNGSLVAYGLL